MTNACTNAASEGGGEETGQLIIRIARVLNWIAVTYRAWKSRQELGKLERFDDRMLRDIGVERADLDWARAQPWPVDATLALAERVRRRRERIRLMRRLRLQAELSRS